MLQSHGTISLLLILAELHVESSSSITVLCNQTSERKSCSTCNPSPLVHMLAERKQGLVKPRLTGSSNDTHDVIILPTLSQLTIGNQNSEGRVIYCWTDLQFPGHGNNVRIWRVVAITVREDEAHILFKFFRRFVFPVVHLDLPQEVNSQRRDREVDGGEGLGDGGERWGGGKPPWIRDTFCTIEKIWT